MRSRRAPAAGRSVTSNCSVRSRGSRRCGRYESAETAREPTVEAAPDTAPVDDRVATLEAEVSALRQAVSRLALAVGEPDPFADARS